MGPSSVNISDHESENQEARRGRPAISPARMLAAADALFAGSDAPKSVTMDAIAAAAGVGKGTLFRAFGSRDGLLDALWAARHAAASEAILNAGTLGADRPPAERAVALLDAILSFKLANRHLIRAREVSPNMLQSEQYKWMHGVLRGMIEEAAPRAGEAAIYAAHALLAALHIDLIEEMLANGLSLETIRAAQAAQARAAITRLA